MPASVLLGRARDSVLGGVNGAWLLWIVATQSLALAAAVLTRTWPAQSSLLVILSLWRHVHERWPLSYEPTLWSVVFPLGMYSVATLTFGTAAHLTFMAPLARFMFWVAVAAWVLVAAALVRSVTRRFAPGRVRVGRP